MASYANSADTFGTLASPSITQIATGTFTVSSTITRYAVTITIPSAATTGIQIELSVTTQTSGTFIIGNVQLEQGAIATPFEQRQRATELALCQRYAWVFTCATANMICPLYNDTTALAYGVIRMPVSMRVAPGLTFGGVSQINYVAPTGSGVTSISLTGTSAGLDQVVVAVPGANFTAGAGAYCTPTASMTAMIFSAEL